MAEVAKEAGVSTATVSYVINGTKPVSREIAERVYQAISKLNYVPNASARSLRTGNSRIIAFLIPDIANLFFAVLNSAIEAVLSHEGYQLLVVNTHEDPQKEREVLNSLTSGKIDGLIIATTMSDYREIMQAAPKSVPIVLVDRRPLNNNTDLVLSDSSAASYESVRYLLRRGHRKIGFIGGHRALSTTAERFRAYRDALLDGGVCVDERLVYFISDENTDVEALFCRLLAQGCTALFVGNSHICMQGVAVLADAMGRCEIVTFLDSPEYKPLFDYMQVHVIEQPVEQIGTAAGRQLLQRLSNAEGHIKEISIPRIFQPRGGANILG